MPDLTKRSFKLGNKTQLDAQLAYINPEFESRVISHILGNLMNLSYFPLYLAIHGKKGEGKSFQTLRICSKFGIEMYYISGAQLCGSYEKDSIEDIEENYDSALDAFHTKGELSVFIIDDFHLSIASTEAGVGRTVNSQILTGFLMNLADKAKADKKSRIPFILMGNDFNHLYDPLTRDGRMDFFLWNPDVEEKAKIVSTNFQDIILPREMKTIENIVREYPHLPVSFFTEIRNDFYKQKVSCYIAEARENNAAKLLIGLNKSITSSEYISARDIYPLIQERLIQQKQKISHEERSGLYNG
ncbi:MAG: AAA family ATPase [Clostridia bacterium]